MSSSPTAPTSTTSSSTGSPSHDRHESVVSGDQTPESSLSSRSRQAVAVVACGAIARHVADVADRRGWPVDVHPLPPLLHNRPERIAVEVEREVVALRSRYGRVAVGYADCGTYGALDEVCTRLGVPRLPGAHCYDLFAGAERMRALMDEEPGTYVLTDFLATSFHRSVVVELGLDRFPDLRDTYFGHYRRVVWLAQHPTAPVRAAAEGAAERIGLPLEVVEVGEQLLEHALEELVAET
jgi:Protein of unknown function (DUF1638)